MKQKTSGMIAFLGILALAGCYTYQGDAINNASYNEVQATPNFALVAAGDSDQMLVRLVNAANNGALTNYTLGPIPAGILVHQNLNYRPVYDPKLDTLVATGDKTQQQYFIVGVTPGKYTFTLTPTSVNTGVSATVTVVVSPKTLADALSGFSATPKAGDTVTITAPANVVFSRSPVITFEAGPPPGLLSVAPDSSSLKILLAPGDSGKLTMTKVGQIFATADTGFTLQTTNGINSVPPLTVAPTTVATTTGLIGVPVTVTLGNNLRFNGSTRVFVGGIEAGVTNVSADSTSASVTPMVGSSGLLTYTGVTLSFLPTVPFSLPGDKSYTVGATYGGPTSANATSKTAADSLPYASNRALVVSDAGPFTTNCGVGAVGATNKCRFYKLTVQSAGVMSGDIRWDAGTTTDLGVYLFSADGTSCAGGIADNQGGISGATGDQGPSFNCSSGAANFSIPAGNYLIVVVDFGPVLSVPWYQFRISQP